MAVIPFGEWRPDVSDYRGEHTISVSNVVPRGDGYGPISQFTKLYDALPAACQGVFCAYRTDGTQVMFAGTATKLYFSTGFSWTDASKGGGSYTTLPNNQYWQFAQFNNFVIAVQSGEVPQVFDITALTTFADLSGSPPNARYVGVINRFLVLGGLASPNGNRIQWSGLNDVTNWTSGVNSSDFQDLPDGGMVRGIAGGGEGGYIFQDRAIRRMTYAPGAPYIFTIDVLTHDDGLYAPYSLHQNNDRWLYLSQQGMKMLLPGGYPTPIGAERIDRTIAALGPNRVIMVGTSWPGTTRSVFMFSGNLYIYDWQLNRWSYAFIDVEFIGHGRNGSNTTTEDLLLSRTSDHALGNISSFTYLEATLTTGERADTDKHIYTNGFRPITDSATVYGSIKYRNNPFDTATQTSETQMNAQGACPQRKSARLARAVVRIPAGTAWTYCAGVETHQEDVVTAGRK